MLIKYTQYKNSFLATMVDLFGSAFLAMGVVTGVTGLFSGVSFAEALGVIAAAAVLILLGLGIKKGARKIAEKKMIKHIEEKKCVICGTKYQEGDAFCPKCGNRL